MRQSIPGAENTVDLPVISPDINLFDAAYNSVFPRDFIIIPMIIAFMYLCLVKVCIFMKQRIWKKIIHGSAGD